MADSEAIGVAYRDQKISGGTVDNTPVGATTASTGAFTTLTASGATTLNGNVAVGDAITDEVGFYGTTAITQRANAAQQTSLVGTASSTDVDTKLKAAVIEVMNTLLALGLWKGSA